jgi:ABC-2 type transport system ATP-binding protein
MIVETNSLSRRFGARHAVENVSLRLPDGAAMALLGANGAGKTTLLRLLLNILRPSAGSARLLGRDSRRLDVRAFQHIGYVSENLALPERLTVGGYFAYLRPLYERWDRQLETQLCKRFALPIEQRIDRLSHGTRTKAMLASALAFRPQLLILDEPLGGLDPAVRDDVLGGLIDRASDTTILMATHELAEIEGFATHVAVMDSGRLLFQEKHADLARRVREVRVQLCASCDLPPGLPESWLAVRNSGRMLDFIEREFVSEAALRGQLETVGFSIERIDVQALSLREIAIALIRATRPEGRA